LTDTLVWPPQACNTSEGILVSPGTYYIVGQIWNITSIILRTPPLQITVLQASSNIQVCTTFMRMDVGEYCNFSALVFGYAPPYSYQWMLNGTNVSGANGSSWTFRPQNVGFYRVSVIVTGPEIGVLCSGNDALVYVYPAVSISSIRPTSVTSVVGQPLTFAENAAGGATPYIYAWGYGSDYSSAREYAVSHEYTITNSTTTTFTFTPTSPGNYTVICIVWDSSSAYWTTFLPCSTASVKVNARDPLYAFWLFRYLRMEASNGGSFRPWSCHPAIPI
jgi:hypothetical protein